MSDVMVHKQNCGILDVASCTLTGASCSLQTTFHWHCD